MTSSYRLDQEILGWFGSLWQIWQLSPESKRNLHSDLNDIPSHEIMHGFWGPVDTSVDWCEHNYVVTYYVAEFWNTLSSVPIVLWALFGIYLHYTGGIKDGRTVACFLSMGFVGFGSVAFHATLRFHAQLLDELPMMIGMIVQYYCLRVVETKRDAPPNYKLLLMLTLLTLFEIVCYVYFQFYVIFIVSYIGLAVVLSVATIRVLTTSLLKKLYAATFLVFWGGIVVWNIEFYYCKSVQALQLHAVWHLCGGYGSYLYILLCIAARQTHLKTNPKVALQPGIGHYIDIETTKAD